MDITLTEKAIEIIKLYGYYGIFIIMILDNIGFPLPSEIILPLAGYMAQQGAMNLYVAAIMGSTGSLIGGIMIYYVAKTEGRKIILKLLISEKYIAKGEKWFKKYGHITVFFARLVPFIGKAISIPAGIARMDFIKYISYSYLGYLGWCSILLYSGYAMSNF